MKVSKTTGMKCLDCQTCGYVLEGGDTSWWYEDWMGKIWGRYCLHDGKRVGVRTQACSKFS